MSGMRGLLAAAAGDRDHVRNVAEGLEASEDARDELVAIATEPEIEGPMAWAAGWVLAQILFRRGEQYKDELIFYTMSLDAVEGFDASAADWLSEHRGTPQ